MALPKSAASIGEALDKSTFYGKPERLCDTGIGKIKGLVALTLLQKFPGLFNQRFPGARVGKDSR
jgi:hypothetical protein